MERKLNSTFFKKKMERKMNSCRLTPAQYWDWLTYIDDDYLTQWEVIKMQELYYWQVLDMIIQAGVSFGLGYAATFFVMGPVIKSGAHGKFLRFPFAALFGQFIAIQFSNVPRPAPAFNDVMCQPSPHGSYLRRSIREHFPAWWYTVSQNLHNEGFNFPEMNEYDKQEMIQKSHTSFNDKLY